MSVLSRLQSVHDPMTRGANGRAAASGLGHRGRIYSAKYGLSDADEEEGVHEGAGRATSATLHPWAAGVAQHSFVSALFATSGASSAACFIFVPFVAAAVHKALDVGIKQQENTFGYSSGSRTPSLSIRARRRAQRGDRTHLAYRAYIVIVSLVGFVWMLIFLGHRRADALPDGSVEAQHGRTAVSGHGHLGWTDNTLFLLGELAQMLHDGVQRGGDVVFLGDLDELDMADEVAVAYPDWRVSFPTVRLHCRRGKPHEVDDLLRVSASAARHVIVLSRDGDRMPRMADSLCLTTLCAAGPPSSRRRRTS